MAKTKIIEIDCLSKYIRYINRIKNVSYYRGEEGELSIEAVLCSKTV